MAARKQVPVLLLTGFLGSGKTSLLARWLKAPEFAGALAIVNELGEVGLDDRLVQTSNDGPILLENGCVCCAASEDLAGTLERLFWDRLHRRIPVFEWVLIETTGIAEPEAVRAALARNDIVAERYRVAGVAATLEAKRGPDLVAHHLECEAQIRAADVVIVTKPDLASEGEMAAAQAVIASLNPNSQALESLRGDLSARSFLDALESAPGASAHAHGASCGHADHQRGHRDHAHLETVSTAFAPLGESVNPSVLEKVLDAAWTAFGGDLLRVKGALRFSGCAGVEIVQSAPGEPIERTPYAAPEGAKPLRTGLTIIARNVAADDVATFIAARLAVAAVAAGALPVGART